MLCTCIGEVEVVGLCGILTSEGVNLLHYGSDAELLTTVANSHQALVNTELLFETYGTRHLEVGEALYLCLAEELCGNLSHALACVKLLRGVHDVLQLLEEPAVDLGEVVNLVDGVASAHSLRDDEDALVSGLAQCLVDVGNLELLVLYEAVHALTNHAETLLDNLFEGATDRHHLTHRLHG